MENFKKNDLVYFKYNDEYYYAIIDEFYADNQVGVYLLPADIAGSCSGFGENMTYGFMLKSENTMYEIVPRSSFNSDECDDCAVKIDPVVVEANEIRQFLAESISFEELTKCTPMPFELKCKRKVKLTSELLALAVKSACEAFDEDPCRLLRYIYAITRLCVLPDENEAKEKLSDSSISEKTAEILCLDDYIAIMSVINAYKKNPFEVEYETLVYFKKMLEYHNEYKNKSVEDRCYPDEVMEKYINYFGTKETMNSASDKEVMLYRIFTDILADKGNLEGLKKKAMGTYGNGNRAYETDFATSLDCLKQLYNANGDPFFANFIGNIYYHGYVCEPDYQEAYKYYSVAALAGYYESMYSLGDMFAKGLGVKQQPYIANKLYSEVYNATYDEIRHEHFDFEFADAAYRLGICYQEGIGCDVDERLSLNYFLQADFAIKKRMEVSDWYGDEKLAEKIKNKVSELEESLGKSVSREKDHHSKDYPWLCGQLTAGGRRVEALYRRIGDDELKLTLALLEHDGTRAETKVFVTIPELCHAELSDEVYYYADKIDDFWCMNTGRFVFNHVLYNSLYERHEFYLFDELVAFIKAKKYTYRVNRLKQAELFIRFVAVSFEGSDKTYNYICDDEKIGIGDLAVVDTADGEKTVTVQDVFVMKESELILPLAKYREIKRKA